MTTAGIKALGIGAIAIGALAAIVLVLIAVFVQFSEELRVLDNSSITLLTLNPNGSATPVGTTGQFPFLQTITGCVNVSDATQDLTTANYTIFEGNSDGGSITLKDTASRWNSQVVNCTALTFLEDSTGQGAADSFVTGFTIFATFSSVIVLALIGFVIVGLFFNGRKGDE